MLHTNLDKSVKPKARNKYLGSEVKVLLSIGIVFSFVLVGVRLIALTKITWDFGTPGEYTLSDSNKIEVTGGEAKLKQVDTTLTDDSQQEFDSGTYTNTTFSNGKLTLGNTAVQTSSSAPGLLAQWKIDSNWNDSKGLRNATPMGGIPFVTGKANTGAYFDGTNYYATIPSLNIQNTTFSVSFWAKPEANTYIGSASATGTSCYDNRFGNRIVFMPFDQYGVANGPKTGLGISVGQNGITLCEHVNGFLPYNLVHGVTLSGWNFITIVNNSNTISLYLNGIYVKSAVSTGKSREFAATSISLPGADAWGKYIGSLDEIEIYTVALSDDYISNAYKRGAALYGEYTSSTTDTQAIDGNSWQNTIFQTNSPYGKELLNNGTNETGYPSGNLSMSGNVGLWHFNNNLNDSSGNSNSAGLTGNTYYYNSERPGSKQAISLDGNNDYISIANSASLNFNYNANFAISVWVKTNSTSLDRSVVEKWSNLGGPYPYVIRMGNGFVSVARYDTVHFVSISTSVAYNDGLWHNFVFTKDNNTLRLYADGVEVGNTLDTTDRTTTNSYPVYLGARGDIRTYDFAGQIDELGIYDRTLSATEIANIYIRGINNVQYQVRSCDDDACSGESFVGPDGTGNTYFSELLNSTPNLPSFDISSLVSVNRYFQYKAILTTSSASYKPELVSVSTTYEGYPVDKPNVRLTTAQDLSSLPSSIDKFCEGTLDVNDNCTTTSVKPANTQIYHQVCNDLIANCDTNNTWKYWDGDSWENANSTQYNTAAEINANISSFTPTTKYFSFKSYLESGGQSTPLLKDISIAVDLDGTPPVTNATNVVINGKNSGDWVNNKPLIEWTGGSDNVDGIGLLGYCIALDESNIDTTQNLNPTTSGGILQGRDDLVSQDYCPYIVTTTSLDLNSLTGLNLTTNKEYNISIKAVDLAGNIWGGATNTYQDLFTFRYDGTPPTNPAFISMPSNFISTKDVTITWPTDVTNGANDVGSALAGLQYKIGASGTWYGDIHNGSQNLTDLLVNDGAYTFDPVVDYPNLIDGSNVIYIRALDQAGNVSVASVTGQLRINTTAPNQVQNLDVDPSDNTQNSYAFNWEVPSTFIGEASGLTYCYTVNTLPNSNNCTYTAPGVTSVPSDAYATQPGTNNFYIVAKDEAGNINYATYSSVSFTYSGEAPGIPVNVDVSDISTKETSDWKLAVTWASPSNVGAGIANYKVLRSDVIDAACNQNLNDFSQVSSVLGTSYIDTGLEQKDYYYCIKACDSANNCSAVSTTKGKYPTGKYTSPATLLSGPTVNATTTRKAVITWTTDRRSDSKIQLGTESNTYFEAESAVSAQVTAHTVTIDNLVAGTTYYYRAKWTDEDGNIGVSEEKSFSTDPAPTIVDAISTRVGIDTAIIQFTSVDAYQVKIYYGLTTSFGGLQILDTSPTQSSYSVILDNLSDNSKYYYKVNPVDAEGFEYEGTVLTFTTLPKPVVSDIQIEEVKNVAQPTIQVNWTSNTEVSSIVTYYPESNTSQTRDAVNLDLVTNHEMQLAGLMADTKYTLIVKGIDKLGNEAVSSPQTFTTATDTRPPTISNVKVEAVNPDSSENTSQIIVSWDTDELSTSQVEYGEGTNGGYPQATQVDNNLGYKHVVIITNLKPASVYHLRALSSDSSENTSETENIVTITPKQQESAFDIVLKGLGDIFSFL